MQASCPTCNTTYNIDKDKLPETGIKARCFNCRDIFEIKPPSKEVTAEKSVNKKVIVANSSKAVCDAVATVVSKEPGFVVFKVTDGLDAMELIQKERPEVVILDVALPRLFGFEICEKIRASEVLTHAKIILVSSIYSKTSYKRKPDTLYGADDYIEKHHIHNDLIPKIHGLLSGVKFEKADPKVYIENKTSEVSDDNVKPTAADAPLREPVVTTDDTVQAKTTVVEQTEADNKVYIEEETPVNSSDDTNLAAAKTFARLIVSDIALYSNDHILEGIKNNNFYDSIHNDYSEGVELFNSRYGECNFSAENILKDAFDEFLVKKKKALGLT